MENSRSLKERNLLVPYATHIVNEEKSRTYINDMCEAVSTITVIIQKLDYDNTQIDVYRE